ncbi:MAG: hypothetical protein WBK08_01045 [Nitrospira sp.]|jgi:hypothetical protein
MVRTIWSMLVGWGMALAVTGMALLLDGGSSQSWGGGSKCVGSLCGSEIRSADLPTEQGEES